VIRLYSFILISFLVFTSLIFSGCTLLPGLKKETVPEEIIYTVPKWKQVGTLSKETPTVAQVLKKHSGTMGSAITIIKSNHYKYDEHFYKTLPFGTNIYISEEGELLIIPTGGKTPDEVVIKRKPNPEYYTTKEKSSKTSSITEEDLTE